ncbi:putative C6 transcription factor [Leptodontidium sp. MPI-SDFR-AT-0119]|nr:putative C6 transcription factor [Leptodontidium sp. MPI-SDFR-AT-0119]
MPYRGKLSKACQRCRERRLKCDLHPVSCSSCIRAKVICTGYRDTQKLRIRNETNDIRKKALALVNTSLPTLLPDVQHFPLSLNFQAREAFFCFHVTEASRTWDFLVKFYHPVDAPEHLTQSIDAVSLAFLSHQRNSQAALASAREKYGSALRMTTRALEPPENAAKYTTILSTLLLDMFEKITNLNHRHSDSWMSHVSGALALVNLQGLDHYQGNDVLRVLGRLSTNLLISCIGGERPVPEQLVALRKYVVMKTNASDSKSKLTELMIDYGILRTDIRKGCLSVAECMDKTLELDAKLQALSVNMPHRWRYKTTTSEGDSERVFCRRVDIYGGRHITQTWNVLRLVRITLNASVARYCLKLQSPVNSFRPSIDVANENINLLVHEICASVPQYLGCFGAGKSDVLEIKVNGCLGGTNHSHSPSQTLDCYTTIFPMYVAAYSQHPNHPIRSWCVEQLRYMSSHFGIRNAVFVAQILEQNMKVDPWAVYARLGSYAFVA